MSSNEAHADNTYVIDTESAAEMARLMDQDQLLTQRLGGLFPDEIDPASLHDILDLACGPGGWTLEVAQAYPQVKVTGVDISEQMIRYAQSHAHARKLNNVSFKVMDILKPLNFPDASFDLINARLLFGFMPTVSWPKLLNECFRMLRPGGTICLTECEIGITNSPATEYLNGIFLRSMQKAGMSFSTDGRHLGITPMLGRLLRNAGFQDTQCKAFALDYSAGTEIHRPFCENIMTGSKLVQPFMLRFGNATQEEVDRHYQQALDEVFSDDFCGIWYYLKVWGKKP